MKKTIYFSANFGVVLWGGMEALEAKSLGQAVFILVGSLLFINLLLWFSFKSRDKREAQIRAQVEAEVRQKIAMESSTHDAG